VSAERASERPRPSTYELAPFIPISTIHTDSTSIASRVQHIHVRLTSPYPSPGAVSLYIYTARSAACSLIVPYARPLSRCLVTVYGHSRARPHSSPSAYNRHTNGHNDVCYGFIDYRPSHSVGRCQWNMTTSYFLLCCSISRLQLITEKPLPLLSLIQALSTGTLSPPGGWPQDPYCDYVARASSSECDVDARQYCTRRETVDVRTRNSASAQLRAHHVGRASSQRRCIKST
jgi:hypothetical protein